MPNETDKGGRAEELLRAYFRELGYFAVRGVKIRIDGVDVTDVDLWLYNRPSPLTRERINVDIKQKKTPQALERVFWARGVQEVLGLDRCIVATTDRRREVVLFGKHHGVTVLDGAFLSKLSEKGASSTMGDEHFKAISDSFRQSKAQISWFEKASECSSVLAMKLGYDGCNSLVPEIRFFVEQALSNKRRREEAVRYVYLIVSYFLVGLDFALSEAAFMSAEERQNVIEEGLRFGQAGKGETERTFTLATRLAVAVTPTASASQIQKTLREISASYPVQILAEFFSRNQVASALFTLAKEFNGLASDLDFKPPAQLTNGVKATLFVFLDFLGVERRAFVDERRTLEHTPQSQARLFDSAQPALRHTQAKAPAVSGISNDAEIVDLLRKQTSGTNSLVTSESLAVSLDIDSRAAEAIIARLVSNGDLRRVTNEHWALPEVADRLG